MHRVLFVSFLTAAVLGCAGSSTTNPMPNSLRGSFSTIERAVGDLVATMNAPTYRPATDLDSDSDRIGRALISLKAQSAGTRFAADADEIWNKYGALEKSVSTRAPLAKQREAVNDLQATVAAAKAKL